MKPVFIVLIVVGVIILLLLAIGIALAKLTAGGKRQTLEEAINWQKGRLNLEWYIPENITEYIIDSYDGYELHAMLVPTPEKTDKYVVITHGYTDNRYGDLKYVKLYLDNGYNCVIYDLRGHGVNYKAPCTYSVREGHDVYCVVQDTFRRYGNDIYLGIHGESLGAASTVDSIKYYKDENIRFAVADCGFADIINVLKVSLKFMHLPGFIIYISTAFYRLMYGISLWKIRPIDALKGNRIPMMFVHGAQDDFIVPDNSKRMYDMTEGYKEIHYMERAGHAESAYVDQRLYGEWLTAFLNSIG